LSPVPVLAMQTLKQIRRSDLSELPVECVDLIALGVYSLYTIKPEFWFDEPCYLMTTNTKEKWVLMGKGAPLDRADNWTGWDDLEQACIVIDG